MPERVTLICTTFTAAVPFSIDNRARGRVMQSRCFTFRQSVPMLVLYSICRAFLKNTVGNASDKLVRPDLWPTGCGQSSAEISLRRQPFKPARQQPTLTGQLSLVSLSPPLSLSHLFLSPVSPITLKLFPPICTLWAVNSGCTMPNRLTAR